MYPFSAVWWSLQTEVQFYLILPVIGLMLLNNYARLALLCMLCVYLYIYFDYSFHGWPGKGFVGKMQYSHSLIGRGVVFIPGLVAAGIYVLHGDRIRHWLAGISVMRSGG